MNQRTRIEICGLTSAAGVDAAVEAGADAIGLVFYAKSPRFITLDVAARLARVLPPLVTPVGLFVNASRGRHRCRARCDSRPAAAVPWRRGAGRLRRLLSALSARRADGAGGRFARLRTPLQRGARPPPRRSCRRFRRRWKGLRLVARSRRLLGRQRASARFVWWVACRKRLRRHPAAAALGR